MPKLTPKNFMLLAACVLFAGAAYVVYASDHNKPLLPKITFKN